MKNILTIALTAILIGSMVKLFSVDDALINFIVLGQIPATEIYLGFFSLLGLGFITMIGLFAWARVVHFDLVIFKLNEAHKDALAAIEEEAAEEKKIHAQAIAQQLDIEELDVISL